jgi:Transglycosylase SLT domain
MQLILKLLLVLGSACAVAQTGKTECISAAATYHGVNPHLLVAVLSVESGLNPHAIGKNTNGTIDMGMAQINSMHLPELQRYGVTQTHLLWLLLVWGGHLPLDHTRSQPALPKLAQKRADSPRYQPEFDADRVILYFAKLELA